MNTASTDYKLEACVTSAEEAVIAAQRGAHRVELCTRLETEGMTPDDEMIKAVCDQISIPVRIMLRETEEGFAADEFVLQKMIRRAHEIKRLPVEGFVIGIMGERCIDRDAMTKLIEACAPLKITFHKAIDQSACLISDLEWLNARESIDTILTSGGAIRAIDGIDELRKLKSAFQRNIMAAGKITPDHVPLLHEALQLPWYHGRAIV